MTRAEIEAAYTVRDGVIRSPGKFEGEPVYAPHIWETALDGGATREDMNGVSWVEILPSDRAEFPEIPQDARYIGVMESDAGFVSVRWTLAHRPASW